MSRLFVTYLEQRKPPAGSPMTPPADSLEISREVMDADSYLDLYRAVGTPLRWDERLRMPRHELDAFLLGPSICVFVLRLHGHAVGLCEFERVVSPDVELKHFGLVPDVQGKRFGPYLLDAALREIWRHAPTRVWLHTDTNDHPKARATYERSGFFVTRQCWEDFPD